MRRNKNYKSMAGEKFVGSGVKEQREADKGRNK